MNSLKASQLVLYTEIHKTVYTNGVTLTFSITFCRLKKTFNVNFGITFQSNQSLFYLISVQKGGIRQQQQQKTTKYFKSIY